MAWSNSQRQTRAHRVYRVEADKLPMDVRNKLEVKFDSDILKKPLKDSLRATFELSSDVDLNADQPLLVSFFADSRFEQLFAVLPVEDCLQDCLSVLDCGFATRQDEDAYKDKRNEVRNLIERKRETVFNEWAVGSLVTYPVTSFIWIQSKCREIGQAHKLLISSFLRGSGALAEKSLENLDSIDFILDGGGLGVVSTISRAQRSKRLLLLMMLVQAYLGALEQLSSEVVECITTTETSPQRNGQSDPIEQKLEEFSRFLIRYYSDDPVIPMNNETFLLYHKMKERFHVKEQYDETVEQLRLMSELSRLQRSEREAKAMEKRDVRYTWLGVGLTVIGLVLAALEFFR